MRIKLILAILLCLFTGSISGVGAGSGGSVGVAWAAGPCNFWVNGLKESEADLERVSASDHNDPYYVTNIQRILGNIADYTEHLVTCTTNNGLPCDECKKAYRILAQKGWKSPPKLTNELPPGYNDNLLRILLLQADHHGGVDKNFTMNLGHPVSKELSNIAAKKWLGQGYGPYIDRGKQIGWASRDGLKTYRWPAGKVKSGLYQSNFERWKLPYNQVPKDQQVHYKKSNGHLNIIR